MELRFTAVDVHPFLRSVIGGVTSARTKTALSAAKAREQTMGNPPNLEPAQSTGAQANHASTDA